ncbi:hypothetical protein [Paenibacillus sacheonensis]|uniref:Uncharacterized protein n=1 Tax=Paenibacillus sacheonensis TaxID=742054 RepID=A0A7X5BYF0_9BACL|nr:hypothetical protein [Paenibacillus sacheonensis]MBM7564843.1 hypothetical protein [Paenibacillus sacheonensis]NBC69391.1 hypothetical protein [Paenibacillus sacheonensis]
MTIQFLDQRISIHNDGFGGTEPLDDLPILIGDIGLQVVAANPANTSNVRVLLTGTANVALSGSPEEPGPTVVSLTVERGGDGTAGTGVMILNQQFEISAFSPFFPISVSAADFPPAAAVLAGEIRYVLFIASDGDVALILNGPVVFNGVAAAGTTT